MKRIFPVVPTLLALLTAIPGCKDLSPFPELAGMSPRFSMPTTIDTRWVYHYDVLDWTRSGVGMGEERRETRGTHIWVIGTQDTHPTYTTCWVVCTRYDTLYHMRTINQAPGVVYDTSMTSSLVIFPMTLSNGAIEFSWVWTIPVDEGDIAVLSQLARDQEAFDVKTNYATATYRTNVGLVKYEYVMYRGGGGINGILSRRLTLVSGPGP